MKHSNKSKRLVSGMLGTACLLSLFSGVAMADVNVSMEQGTPETKIELNKTYKGEKDYGYYSFIPEETGAYLLDNNDFNDEVDSFAFVYCFDDASSLALFKKGDDSYVRKTAIKARIPYITTMAAAKAAADGIYTVIKEGEIGVKSLQDIHACIE